MYEVFAARRKAGYNACRNASGLRSWRRERMQDKERYDLSEYITGWRARLAREERERQARIRDLRRAAQMCARRLVQDFGATRVYLFGSLCHEELAHERSDVDLAVEGLDGSLYFAALRDLWDLLPAGAELDLVMLERAWPGLAERVRREGVLLDVAA